MGGCNSSGILTATKVVNNGRCRIASVRVATTGNTAGSISVYDSATATTSGKKEITRMYVGASADVHNHEFDMHGTIAAEGVYVVVTGTIAYSIEFY